MAEVDTRIETLEDEIKVLKGEVRRTLVDLRALLMREDSPLNESTFGRQPVLRGTETSEEPPVTRKELTELVKQETAEIARPPVPDTQPPSPPPAANPVQPVAPGVGMATPGSAFPGMPFAQSPPWGVGGGYPSGPPQAQPPGPQLPDSAMAERERKLAEQERRMEDQERRLADQERRVTSAAQSESTTPPPDPAMAERERKLAEQERRMEEQEGRLADQERMFTSAAQKKDEQERDFDQRIVREEPTQKSADSAVSHAEPEKHRDKKESDIELDRGEQTLPNQGRSSEHHASEEETILPLRWSSSDRGNPGPTKDPEDRDSEQAEVLQPARLEDDGALQNDTARIVRSRSEAKGSPGTPEWPLGDYGEEEGRPKTITGNGRGNRVYDEYKELLGETEELEGSDGVDLGAFPLDVNLLSSLTRWTTVARNRVGEQRLIEILDLYSQSGHLSNGLRELLRQISSMVGNAHPETSDDAQGFVDLIFHLHGILSGGLAIRQIQHAKPAL